MFEFTYSLPQVLQVLIAVVLPLAVGLVTNRVTQPRLKALLLLALSIVTAGVTTFAADVKNGTTFDVGLWGISALGTFLAGVGLHYGLYKPTGAAEAMQDAIPVTQPKVQGRDARGRWR